MPPPCHIHHPKSWADFVKRNPGMTTDSHSARFGRECCSKCNPPTQAPSATPEKR